MAKKKEVLWQPLCERRTFQFRLGWDCDDLWVSVGKVRFLSTGRKIWEEDHESHRRTSLVTVRSSAGIRQIKRALSQHFTFGCQCGHDCCGCAFCYLVDVRRVKRREYLITQYVGYNC